MKETRPEENDRNTASPTESAVCGRQEREHSGADYLNRIMCKRNKCNKHLYTNACIQLYYVYNIKINKKQPLYLKKYKGCTEYGFY